MSLFGLLVYEVEFFTAFLLFFTATGTPIMRFFVRSLSWGELARVCAVACALAWGAYFVFIDVVSFGVAALGLGTIRSTVIGQLGLVPFFASAILITRGLRKKGVSQSFPGIGARVAIGWLAISWLMFGLYYAATKLI